MFLGFVFLSGNNHDDCCSIKYAANEFRDLTKEGVQALTVSYDQGMCIPAGSRIRIGYACWLCHPPVAKANWMSGGAKDGLLQLNVDENGEYIPIPVRSIKGLNQGECVRHIAKKHSWLWDKMPKYVLCECFVYSM